MITLASMAELAVGVASRASTAFHTVSVEEARKSVKVKDGNRKPATDGSQKLTVVIGKHTLPLDCIKAGTTRLDVSVPQAIAMNVTIEDAVSMFTDGLLQAVEDGAFDAAIEVAQGLAKEQAAKAAANPRTSAPKVTVEETAGLDLDDLEA